MLMCLDCGSVAYLRFDNKQSVAACTCVSWHHISIQYRRTYWQQVLTLLPMTSAVLMGDGRHKTSTPSLSPCPPSLTQAELCNVLVKPFLVDIHTQSPASSSRNTSATSTKRINAPSLSQQLLWKSNDKYFLMQKSKVAAAVAWWQKHSCSSPWNTQTQKSRGGKFPILTSKMHQGHRLERPIWARCIQNHPTGSSSTCQHQWAETADRGKEGSPGYGEEPASILARTLGAENEASLLLEGTS